MDLDDILSAENVEEYHVNGEELERACELAEEVLLEYNSGIKSALKNAAPETFIDVTVGFGPKLHFGQLAEKLGVREEEVRARHVFLVLSAEFFLKHRRSYPDKCSINGLDPSNLRLTWIESSPGAVSRPDWSREMYIDFLPPEFESLLEQEFSGDKFRSDAPKLLVDAVKRALFNRREKAGDKNINKARYLATIAHEQTHIYLNESTNVGDKRKQWYKTLSNLEARKREDDSENYTQIFDEGAAFFTSRAITGENNEKLDESNLGDRSGLPIGYKSKDENLYVAQRLQEKWSQDSSKKAIDFAREFMREVFQKAFQQEKNIERVFLREILFARDKKNLYVLNSEKNRLSNINRHLKEVENFLENQEHGEKAEKGLQRIDKMRQRTVELEEDLLKDIYGRAVKNNMSLREIHSVISEEEKEIVKLLLDESELLEREIRSYGEIIGEEEHQRAESEVKSLRKEAERLKNELQS